MTSVFDSFVHDFMRLNHNPVDEELKLQSNTERLIDRWHGLVLKKGNSQEDGLDCVENRIKRNIQRHEKMLDWITTMERHMQHDAMVYANADACQSIKVCPDRPTTELALVNESERILKQIDTLLNERREWEASFSLEMPSLSTALYMA